MEDLVYWWRFTLLRLARSSDDLKYGRLISQAKKGKDRPRYVDLVAERTTEDALHEMDISELQSKWLIRKADGMLLPGLNLRDDAVWEDGQSAFGILSRESRALLRAQIETERNYTRAAASTWIAGFTGVGGVAVAILALLLKGGT